jgi:hypothetical protein
LLSEGRALSKEESAVVDAELGLTDSVGGASEGGWASGSGGSSSSDEGEGGGEGELAASVALRRDPLLALQSSASGQFLAEHNQERPMSNAGNLQVSFLWGGTAPNGVKHATACVLRSTKGAWLFGCGEDTQRHLNRRGTCAARITPPGTPHDLRRHRCCSVWPLQRRGGIGLAFT